MSTLKQLFSCFGSQGREGHFREESIFPIAGLHPWGTMRSAGIISPSPTQAISLEQVFFISTIILDTYILAVDIY